MLVALLPDQISDYWPMLQGHIEDSLPPTGDYGPYDMNNILYNALAGYAQIWVYHNANHESQGFVVTTIMNDISGVRTLLIYCVVVIDKSAKVDWTREFNTLRKFANSKGCSKIGSFIMNEKVIALLKNNDVETRFTYANMNI